MRRDPTDRELDVLEREGLLPLDARDEVADPADRGRRVPWHRALELLKRDEAREARRDS